MLKLAIAEFYFWRLFIAFRQETTALDAFRPAVKILPRPNRAGRINGSCCSSLRMCVNNSGNTGYRKA